MSGELWVGRKTVSRIVQNMLHGIKCGLTPREIEIEGLAEGLKNSEIGESLFSSVKTVSWHLRSPYGKPGTHDRFYAASYGWFERGTGAVTSNQCA